MSNTVACGCVIESHLSDRQSLWRAFLKGLSIRAFPRDYPERDVREAQERIDHILNVHLEES